MNEQTKVHNPAWQRIVSELVKPAADDADFLARLLGVLAQVCGARQAAIISIPSASGDDPGFAEPRVRLVWPPQNAAAPSESPPVAVEPGENTAPLHAEAQAKRAALQALATNSLHIASIDAGEGTYYDLPSAQLIAVPVAIGVTQPGSGQMAGVGSAHVATLLVENRSKQAMQTTAALAELVAGYAHTHGANQSLRETRAATTSLDLAATLISTLNTATSFKGATIQLVNDLMRHLHADRVALGWCKGLGRKGEGERVKVIAISDTEQIDRRMRMVQMVEAAMDEALDQDQPVMFPAPAETGPGGDVLLAQAVTHAHRDLVAGDAKLTVASLPLRVDDTVVGVLTVESADAQHPLDATLLEILQATLDLVAPVMRIRRSDDRMLPLRAMDSTIHAAGWFVGPKHTVWKLGGIAVMLLLLAVIFIQVPYRVEAPCTVEPRTKRTISAPFAGVIATVPEGIEPGARVEQGQLLAQLDVTELELQRLDVLAEILRAEKQADTSLNEGKLAEAQQAQAQADQARARLELIEFRIGQAAIRAPIGGTVIAGDLGDLLGASIELGQALYEVAAMDDMVVIARVPDSDIRLIQDASEGDMATKAFPAQRFEVTPERIVPLAQPDEGTNTFEVRAALTGSAPWMRPGMEGLVKFDTGERTLIDIGTRRIRDTIRLWLWW